ncbi:hypothetical protein [Ensifer sp. ENS12]|uniref:hypothetical protein n=1 Tax=Ensifer sp. ENS12 TaxID=2854774 RepID=UPI001C442642|nr:hypothetical protein [Ensifer sp. ENS12]MBV7519071.1 hypothetical protein [Ensifer sp. ENS12]
MRTWGLAIAVALALSSCVSAVDNKIDDGTTVAKLSSEIECELKAAFPPPDPKDKKAPRWTVTYAITENVKDSGIARLDVINWIVPANVDRFILGGGASIYGEKERNAKAEFNVNLSETEKIACEEPKVTPKFRLQGWTDQVKAMGDRTRSFGYTVAVTVDGNANITADFANGRAVGLGTVAGGRKTIETIDFAFSRVTDDQPLEVYVTNFPPGLGAQLPPKRQTGVRAPLPVSGSLYEIPAGNIQQNRFTIQQLQIDRIDRNSN